MVRRSFSSTSLRNQLTSAFQRRPATKPTDPVEGHDHRRCLERRPNDPSNALRNEYRMALECLQFVAGEGTPAGSQTDKTNKRPWGHHDSLSGRALFGLLPLEEGYRAARPEAGDHARTRKRR